METRVTYTTAVSSMDSWDMENLKYIKNISKNNPNTSSSRCGSSSMAIIGNPESGTYISSKNSEIGEEEEEIYLKEISKFNQNINIKNRTSIIRPNSINSIVDDNISNTGTIFEEEENDHVSGNTTPLDTCYLLDVVTIRNESVMAIRHPKSNLGSDGSSSTSSSAESSIEEGNFFDDTHDTLPDFGNPGRFSRTQSRTSSNSTLIEQQSQRNTFKSPCPYCDNGMNNEYFYLGQKGNFEDTSLVPTVGGEGPPEMPRTPSPYYVRLRRDLTSYTPSLRQPRNFGMDKQGQLQIDYSPNWAGLEKYVRNLKRC